MMNMNETHSLIHSHGLIHRSVGKEKMTFKRHESDELSVAFMCSKTELVCLLTHSG